MAESGTVTILFTDLVDSTALLERTGDEFGRRILRGHRAVLANTGTANRGREVKWTGDGMMLSFSSTADAVRAAVAMQRAARGPIEGERLDIRIGVHVGEAFEEEGDFYGSTVVLARRLCDAAKGRQILCSELVSGLLRGHRSFTFVDCGELALKGIEGGVRACEVDYDVGPRRLPMRTSYVGRHAELGGLLRLGEQVRAGRGAVALVAGEPGIGKTRIADETADAFRAAGALVVWGRCHGGEWSPPFAPFVEAIESYLDKVDASWLPRDLAEPLSTLLPSLTPVDGTDATTLSPDEQRYRLTLALARFLLAAGRREPLMVVLDDLHWADSTTVTALRHLAGTIDDSSVFVLGTYRPTDVVDQPFGSVLADLARETDLYTVALRGLDANDVAGMLETFTDQDLAPDLVGSIVEQTGGNPFFVRELLLHMLEDGVPGAVPDTVRHVLDQRIARLSADTRAFLAVGAAFDAGFDLRVVAAIADLTENRALDALDEAVDAQLVVPSGGPDQYRFTHALLRPALLANVTPSWRVRLHRRIAERLVADLPDDPPVALIVEIAEHYHRSRDVDGAQAGLDFAAQAAEHARSTGVFVEAERYYRLALDLSDQPGDRGVMLLRLALALAWSLKWDESVSVAREGAAELVEAGRRDEAADRLALASATISDSGSDAHAWELIPLGLELVGDRRDLTWAVFTVEEVFRSNAQDPDSLGVELDVPTRHELNDVLRRFAVQPPPEFAELRAMAFLPMITFESRAEVAGFFADRRFNGEMMLVFAGALREVVDVETRESAEYERRGQLASATFSLVNAVRARIALGQLDEARAGLAWAWDLAAIIPRGGYLFIQAASAQEELTATVDDGWEEMGQLVGVDIHAEDPVQDVDDAFRGSERQFLAAIHAAGRAVVGPLGRADHAMRFVELIVPAIRLAPSWAINIPRICCLAAETLWLTGRTDHLDVIEQAVHDKLVVPDFRYPSVDGRLALAQLAALRGDLDGAREWFARARTVLDEQGARPLLAICDHDEALMYARAGDRARAEPLFDKAILQFADIGMTGWLTRAAREKRGG